MAVPQVVVAGLLFTWGKPFFAAAILALIAAQIWAMSRMLQDPKARAPWYNGTGVAMYVSGMMIAAFALRSVL